MPYLYDHRQLAEEMELFFIDDQVGSGLPIWLPYGFAIQSALEKWIVEVENREGYLRVSSPALALSGLFEKSGHLSKFKNEMYPPIVLREAAIQACEMGQESFDCKDEIKKEVSLYLRPMNCPHHHQIFAHKIRSYRELPLRIAEYGQIYRFERSGSLRGLSRARSICQNDAHIYVDPSCAFQEIQKVLKLFLKCYAAIGISNYQFRLSLSNRSQMSKFDGSPEDWSLAESLLRQALEELGLSYVEAMGEAAFYGPKIDIQVPLFGERQESIASLQLDFNSAKKFGLKYTASGGALKHPWIIHRAPMGSHERFVSYLLEFFDGHLPAWLAPIQLLIFPVSDLAEQNAREIEFQLRQAGIRVCRDASQGSLSKRLRLGHRLRPFAKIVIGNRELEGGNLVLQLRQENLGVRLADLRNLLEKLCAPPAI